jgi:Rrf2 family transcriptional regulator, cysteine metabolism repressor
LRISTRARYGTRAMLELALNYGQGPLLVKDIASKQKLSNRYLEQLLLTLKLAGLVRSSRGHRGGFMLARKPSQVRLLEIVQALDGPIAPVDCVDEPDCYPRAEFCATREVWTEVKRAVSSVLNSITLQHLVIKYKEKEAAALRQGIPASAIFALCEDEAARKKQ